MQLALDAGTDRQALPGMPEGHFRAVALARLPVQRPLVGWAARVARRH